MGKIMGQFGTFWGTFGVILVVLAVATHRDRLRWCKLVIFVIFVIVD
jgi:hypothetical protein